MEEVNHRLAKSLSDLNGTDPNIHNGNVKGIFREIGNAFSRRKKPGVPEMWSIYREVRKQIPAILARCGTQSVFEARAFEEISYAARVAAKKIVK
jgi:hypothetical protein